MKHVVRLLAVALTGAIASVAQAQHRDGSEDYHFSRGLRQFVDLDGQRPGLLPSHYERQPVRLYDTGNAGSDGYRSGNYPRHGHDQWSPLSRDSHYVVEIRRNYDAVGDSDRRDGHHYERETHFDRRY